MERLDTNRILEKMQRNLSFDEDGRVIITMSVRSDDDFLSPYSVNDEEMISSDVASFISDSVKSVHPKIPITLNIHSNCIDHDEEDIYRNAIKSYFILQNSDNERDMKKNGIQAIAMAIIGIIAFASMFIAENHGVRRLWIECINIFAWVFIWESVDLFFISRSFMRMKRKRLKNLIDMKVIFTKLNR